MPTLLVLSGLDPTGGAGFLADARVAAAHDVRAVGVITATTVQDTSGVHASWPMEPELVGDALRALLADVEVDAVKIGMLGHARTAQVIAASLAATRAPVVWDPVLTPSRGRVRLLEGDVQTAIAALLPEVRLLTPNVPEAEVFSGMHIADEPDMRAAARVIAADAVLVKGGHIEGREVKDVLRDGGRYEVFSGPRIEGGPFHGTGCVLSTAIACGLARLEPLEVAVGAARQFLAAKLRRALIVGRGAKALV